MSYLRIALGLLSAFQVAFSFAQEKDSISFRYDGHILCSSIVNDSLPCNLLFDTGAADVFGLDTVFLAHSTWKPTKLAYGKAKGAAGTEMVRIIIAPTDVKLGSQSTTYPVVPIYRLRDIVDRHVDGIIGIKDLEKIPFEINFEQRYIRKHSSLPKKTANYIRIPIVYKDKKILLPATIIIDGTEIKGTYLMDTGSGGSISFTAEAVKQFKLETIQRKRRITDITNPGIGNKKQETYVSMLSDEIIIGKDTLRENAITYVPKGIGAMGKTAYIGIIGNQIWSKYNIILDISHQCIYLQRFKKAPKQVAGYDYGFRNRTDICDGWIIHALEREGDAVKAGIQLGDIILKINGKSTKDFTWEEENNINKTPEHHIEIRSTDGTYKTIKLVAKNLW